MVSRKEYMEKFDLSSEELVSINFRVKISSRPSYVPLSRAQVQKQVRAIFRKHEKIGCELVREQWPHVYDQAIRKFGSWETALKSVGVASWRMERLRDWSAERVIRELRALYKKNGHLVLRREEYGILPWYTVRFFGSWTKAVKAAGFDPRLVGNRQEWSREKILKMIPTLNRSKMSEKENTDFSNACRKYFGNVETALNAKGRTWEEFFGTTRWSKNLVLQKLKEFRKKRGNCCAALIRKDDEVLYQMAVKFYGSWIDALLDAGIVPARKSWTQESLAREVFRFLDGGKKPTNTSYVQRHRGGLYSTCFKYFGSWKAAVEAAGLSFKPVDRVFWTDQRVVSEIQRLSELGKLSGSTRVSIDYVKLYIAAKNRFGDWNAALVASGVHNTAFRPKRKLENGSNIP